MAMQPREAPLEDLIEGQRKGSEDLWLQEKEVEVKLAAEEVSEGGEGLILVQILYTHCRHIAHALDVADIRSIARICLQDRLQGCTLRTVVVESALLCMSAREIVLDRPHALLPPVMRQRFHRNSACSSFKDLIELWSDLKAVPREMRPHPDPDEGRDPAITELSEG
jgi:hypothetical protein